ncbi:MULTISPECIES: hypothetical protein [Agrobacterium]|uniref:hypothetical protein n=1 Tax=Agrobacterium TaxID=357 RepID=UPI0012D2F659|nr:MULTISPECIES: hypothetical protein [Agrobacterium]
MTDASKRPSLSSPLTRLPHILPRAAPTTVFTGVASAHLHILTQVKKVICRLPFFALSQFQKLLKIQET